MITEPSTSSDRHREIESLGVDAIMSLVAKWRDPNPKPVVSAHQARPGVVVTVVREDVLGVGTKVRAASAYLSRPEFRNVKTIVYSTPRTGWAGISLAAVAKQRGIRLILLCPASAKVSDHQRAAYELGAELRFVRVPIMPLMSALGRKLAARLPDALFLPLGLTEPAAIAGIAATALRIGAAPKEVWCAGFTGALTRGLQIAWPTAQHNVVTVGRGFKDGEKGSARVYAHPYAFLRNAPESERPPYPSAANYDAKVWRFVTEHATNGAVIWNVAGSLNKEFKKPEPNSYREWRDYSDLEKD